MLFESTSLVAQTFKVLVLDALNGTPQANVRIENFCAGPPSNALHRGAVTGKRGLATVTYLCTAGQEIELSAFSADKKEQCGGGEPITLAEILAVGIVTKPDAAGDIWCPAKVSTHVKPVPGLVVIFVKKPSWWQSHVAG